MNLIEWLMQCAMFWPLACYLFAVGLLNYVPRRPVIVPGAADTAGLCCALAGLFVIGPMGLILRPLLRDDGTLLLVVGGTIYFVIAALVIGSQRRRLVIYNCAVEQFQQAWGRVVAAAGPDTRHLGDFYVFPTWGVTVRVEAFGVLRNYLLIAESVVHDSSGWSRMARSLQSALDESDPVPRSLRAPAMLWAACLLLLLTPVGWLLADEGMAAEVVEFLRRLAAHAS